MDLMRLQKNFALHGFSYRYFETRSEAAAYLAQQTAGTAGAAQNSLEGQTQAAVAGLSGTDSTMNMIVSSYQTVMQVKRALHDIKYAPDVSMGAVVKE